MSDVAMPPSGASGSTAPAGTQWSPPPMMVGRQHLSGVRAVATVVGVIAGGVGFAGFWVNFFSSGDSTLASASSGWFDLVPIFIGLGVIGLFMPRLNYFFSGLPLISLGVVFGMRGFISGLGRLFGAAGGRLGYGPGFWMICFGAGILTLAALWIIGDELRGRVRV